VGLFLITGHSPRMGRWITLKIAQNSPEAALVTFQRITGTTAAFVLGTLSLNRL